MWKKPVATALVLSVGFVQADRIRKNIIDPTHQLPDATGSRVTAASTNDTGQQTWGLRPMDNTTTEVVMEAEPRQRKPAIEWPNGSTDTGVPLSDAGAT
jgi:hypothetical protein